MRLLHVIAALVPGGAERIVLQLVSDARRHGDTVGVAAARGTWVEELAAGSTYFELPHYSRSAPPVLAASWRLRSILRAFRPDIVHTHNVKITVPVAIALRSLRSRPVLLTTLHGVRTSDYRPAARLLRLSGAEVIACAPAVARSLEAAGLPAGRLEVIANGTALEPATPDREQTLKARLEIGPGPLVVGLGRLAEEKAWPTLIEAAGHLDGVEIVVAGAGPLHGALKAAATAAGGRVRFVGMVDDVAALLGLADCIVSTSAREGLPLSLLEALALGTPAVATAVGGVVDVAPPDAAMLVPPGDAAAVAAAIDRVLHEPGLASHLSERGRQIARAWRPETMLDRYRQRYDAAITQRTAAVAPYGRP